MALGSTQPLKK